MSIRTGVRIGVDVGTVRVGVARCDPHGILTSPVETLLRAPDGSELDRLAEIIDEYAAIEVIVGLPRHLKGGEGVSAKGARRYARRIKDLRPGIRVALVDERLSSNQAHQRLRESGVDERRHRDVVDQVAAQIILESALDEERMRGDAPGIEISRPEGKDDM
ncbi:Holliday junction resolvase RuvX [Schaalia sp. ZJ1691]|uniref:Holliday junction resolvase RuvX n=1 Tax=Schaalia sp. ZJ1691 TaxID=2709404 RepID=UPI0013ED95D3|nr:Holliday junction resolvase RuvX [Schaalia sp. ZJ1691]